MTTVLAQGSVVLLAWLDSTSGSDVVMAAAAGGQSLSPDRAFARLFPDGRAGASRVLPWLEADSRPQMPMCAYAAIRDDACVRSGFVLHPTPDDIARLERDFRTFANGASGARLLDAVRSPLADGARIDINIFTGTATCGGRDIALSDGEFAVACAIAMNRTAISREEWCDTLWPDRDPESAARLLKVYVHRIRTKFGTDRVIETHGNGYRLGREVRVDVHSLEMLSRQCAGAARLEPAQVANVRRAFEGCTERRYRRLEGLDAYAVIERRIVAIGIEIGRILVRDALDRDDGASALTIADHLVRIDPYDEVAIEMLLRAQLRLGRRDAASRSLRDFCRTLQEELELPAPQHLVRLLQETAEDGDRDADENNGNREQCSRDQRRANRGGKAAETNPLPRQLGRR